MADLTDVRMRPSCTPLRFGMLWREKSSGLRETTLGINVTKTDKAALFKLETEALSSRTMSVRKTRVETSTQYIFRG